MTRMFAGLSWRTEVMRNNCSIIWVSRDYYDSVPICWECWSKTELTVRDIRVPDIPGIPSISKYFLGFLGISKFWKFWKFICWNSSFRASGRTKISKKISRGDAPEPRWVPKPPAVLLPRFARSSDASLRSIAGYTVKSSWYWRMSLLHPWRGKKGMKINGDRRIWVLHMLGM